MNILYVLYGKIFFPKNGNCSVFVPVNHFLKDITIQKVAVFYKIVNNLIIDEYRKKEHVSLDRMREEGFDPGYDVRGEMESRDEYHHVLAKMEKLPERYRESTLGRHLKTSVQQNFSRAQMLAQTLALYQ